MAKGRGRGRLGGARGNAQGAHGRGRGRGTGNFLGVHTARQAGAIANAQAGTEYNPEIRLAREEAKGSRQRQRDLGSWYSQLANDYANAQQAGSQALASVEGATQQQQQEAASRAGSELGSLKASDEAFAKLTGAPTDTSGLAKIAQATGAAERARVAEQKPVLSEQADYVARLGSDKAAARLQGIESRQTEAQRREKLKSNIGALQHEKGSARVSNLEKLREADRAYSSEVTKLKLAKREARSAEESAAASAALAQAKARQEAVQDAIANRQAQERIGVSRTNAKISAKNARTSRISAKTSARSQRATKEHYEKETGANGLTAGERQTIKGNRQNAAATVGSILATGVHPHSNAEWAELEAIAVERGAHAADVRAAVARAKAIAKEKARRAYGKRHLKELPPLPAR